MKGSCVPILILSLGLRVRFLAGYNLDTEQPISFSGPTGSMFGYSVLLHTHTHNNWLLVGAPVDNSSSSAVRSPGAVYQCSISSKQPACQQIQTGMGSCGKTCKPESEDQWLGVSLSRDPVNGDILACGHRWKNVFYSQKDVQNNKLPHGVCYRYSNDLSQPGQAMIPCYRDHQKKFGDLYGSCQAGMSTFLTEELVIMGAPGTSYWTGSVLVYNTSSRTMAAYLDEGTGQVQFGSYLGYSVGAGHFLHPGSTEVVGGAPQHSQTGKAYVFQVEGSLLKIVSELSGDKLGSYFGASVCSVDLNADGLSDLLVGAPLTSSSTQTGAAREEGRVHVYINHGEARLIEADFQLQGRDSYAARFGQTMINLGDLDDDGYHDVAIGAPQEEDLKGAVYIYNGGKDGISERYSQRISGQVLGRDLSMFGESLSSGVDIDDNGYQDVAIGAFLSDAAVVLRTRPVLKVEASLLLPDRLNRSVAACQDHPGAGLHRDHGGAAGLASRVCANVTVCFRASARQYRGYIDIHYNLTADVLHKASFPHRFYFHGNGSSNGTTGRIRTRLNQLTCAQHLTYLRREVRDIYTPVQFEASYWLRQPSVSRSSSRSVRSLKPILQQRPGSTHTVTNQTKFSRFCLEVNCSTNLQLSAQLVLPQNLSYFALGNGRSILLKTTLANSGDDSFLPRMSLRFPTHIHYIKVLQSEVSCDVSEGGVDCSISSLSLPAHTELNINFLLDVNQSSSAGDVSISVNASSDNYEMEEYLGDNTVSLLLPLRYGVDVNVHGFVSPTSFVFGDEQSTPVDCYSESFNFTYKVLNLGPSRSVDSVLEIELPKSLSPYSYRLLQLTDWQSSQGQCHLSNQTATVEEECDLPGVSVLKQIVFYFSKTTTRRMFCGRQDILCERLVCYLGNLESGKEATVQITTKLNPTVLLQYPGRHGIMVVESIAVVTSPTEDEHTIVTHTLPLAQVAVEAHFNQKPPAAVQIFIIIVSLIIGLLILTALIYCLWKAGFFKRHHQKTEDDFKRESWDYVPKMDKTESSS